MSGAGVGCTPCVRACVDACEVLLSMLPTSACEPGVSVLLHFVHLRQAGCQSFPSDVFRSAETHTAHCTCISFVYEVATTIVRVTVGNLCGSNPGWQCRRERHSCNSPSRVTDFISHSAQHYSTITTEIEIREGDISLSSRS